MAARYPQEPFAERARPIGLFRYSLIREAADPGLTSRQRGRLVREVATSQHLGPFGAPVRVSRRRAARPPAEFGRRTILFAFVGR